MIKATFILALALAAVPAMAQTITFTISADGSGTLVSTLGSTTFTDQLITFTQVTTISGVEATSCGYPCAPKVDTNTVTIGGMAPVMLTGGSYFFDNAINVIGIANAPYSTFLGEEADSLASYTMTTSFGPTSFPICYECPVGLSDVPTSGGDLTITWPSAEDATFTAVVGSPTPEPASFFLMGSGLLAMGGILRRRISRR